MKSAVRWLMNTVRRPDAAHALILSYRRAFDGDDGRRVLADLTRYCCAGRSAFVPGDPHQTSFNAGQQDVYWHIAAMLDLTPADLPPLLTETAPHD